MSSSRRASFRVNDQPVRPAATVIIARDAQPQYEIFMLRRTNEAVFASGMYVFPGGRVEPADHSEILDAIHDGPAPEQHLQQAALGADWRGYWIAGIRETFEESGILLAHNPDGSVVSFAGREAEFDAYQQALNRGELTLEEICKREGIKLAINMIHFYNRWITPPGRPRRFDTRFFITQAPAAQAGSHDGRETVESIWISPGEAIRRNQSGEFEMMAVTVRQLQDFNRYRRCADFISMARENTQFPTHRPTIPVN